MGLGRWQQQLAEVHLAASHSTQETLRLHDLQYKKSLLPSTPMLITPVTRPPSYSQVKEWLKAKTNKKQALASEAHKNPEQDKDNFDQFTVIKSKTTVLDPDSQDSLTAKAGSIDPSLNKILGHTPTSRRSSSQEEVLFKSSGSQDEIKSSGSSSDNIPGRTPVTRKLSKHCQKADDKICSSGSAEDSGNTPMSKRSRSQDGEDDDLSSSPTVLPPTPPPAKVRKSISFATQLSSVLSSHNTPKLLTRKGSRESILRRRSSRQPSPDSTKDRTSQEDGTAPARQQKLSQEDTPTVSQHGTNTSEAKTTTRQQLSRLSTSTPTASSRRGSEESQDNLLSISGRVTPSQASEWTPSNSLKSQKRKASLKQRLSLSIQARCFH